MVLRQCYADHDMKQGKRIRMNAHTHTHNSTNANGLKHKLNYNCLHQELLKGVGVSVHVLNQVNEHPTRVFGTLLRVKHVIVKALLECNCSKMLSVTALCGFF